MPPKRLLEGKKGSALHLQIRLEIDSNLVDKTLEGCLPDQYVLLVFTYLAKGIMPPILCASTCTAFVARCIRGAFPPVDLRALCLHLAIVNC